jgi:hypothetical protein
MRRRFPVRKATQASLFDEPRQRAPKDEAKRWACYIVGGWPGYSAWIDPRDVPLCSHDHHGRVDGALASALITKCLVPSLLVKRCLALPWRQYRAGTACITYGTIGDVDRKFDLFILQEGP